MLAKWTTLLVLLLLPLAAAQPGPAPGYDTALDYAEAYAASQLDEAAADPSAYAGNHTTPEALQNETTHTAWLACWAADDAGVEAEPCDAYYTARGEEQPDQPTCKCATGNETDEFAALENETASFQNTTTTFVNDTAADPANATEHAETFVQRALGFVGAVGDAAVTFVTSIVDGIMTCIGILGDVGLATASSVGTVFTTVGDTAESGLGAVGELAGDAGKSTGAGLGTFGEALLDGAGAVGDGVVSAVGAVGDGIVTAAKATGSAVAAVGEAIGDAATAIKDAVTGLFGDDPTPEAGQDLDKDVDDTADGLLDGVGSLLERV